MKARKKNSQQRRNNNDSKFFEQLKCISKLLKTKKEIVDIDEIYVSQTENEQIINVFYIIKYINNNDLDSVFDLYSQFNEKSKVNCLQTMTSISANPFLINWLAHPKTNLAKLKKTLVIKKISLSQFLLINRLSKLFIEFKSNKLRSKSKLSKASTNQRLVEYEQNDFDDSDDDIGEFDQIVCEIVELLIENGNIFDWFLHDPRKGPITMVLKILTSVKNRCLLIDILNITKNSNKTLSHN